VTFLKPFIFNATPLIYLCKIGLSFVFTEFLEEKYTTLKVVDEVVNKGKILGTPDAFIVERLIKRSAIKVMKPVNTAFVDQLLKTTNLHQAEIEVLALTKELNGIAIIDEAIARQVARIYNVQAHGTAYLLLRLVYKGKLSKKQVRKAFDKMISVGWRLTAEEYGKLIQQLENL